MDRKPREIPIVLRPWEIEAALDHRKREIRRPVAPQPVPCTLDEGFFVWRGCNRTLDVIAGLGPVRVGDILYGQEICLVDGWYDGDEGKLPLRKVQDTEGREHTVLYYLEYPDLMAIDDGGSPRYNKDGWDASPWCSPARTPRWACRVRRRVTKAWVEPLQAITRAGAVAEGIIHDPVLNPPEQPVNDYKYLWGRFYGQDSWFLNPLVWGYELAEVAEGEQ